MPALDDNVIRDVEERLKKYLVATGGYNSVDFIDAGGSAAVFKVNRNDDIRAIKIFDPKFFVGNDNLAEKRRLLTQQKLIDHDCEHLIQTYYAGEIEDTAIVEMEFLSWPQLAKVLDQVPDDCVRVLIKQLVEAVRYLESLNIVHRDIKPENIHVSEDFKKIKLLDLGVIREFDNKNEDGITDNGHARPFLATAQYSSPEYLFRLDEPTEKLWRGLNIYQVGAVLHDLINKEPIFNEEMSVKNRWLVARAVLTKTPSFLDVNVNRLAREKALALRCLSKDLDTRISLVNWNDFYFDNTVDPLASLRNRLLQRSNSTQNNDNEKIIFERNSFIRGVSEKIRTELIDACGKQLPVVMPTTGDSHQINYFFSYENKCVIACSTQFVWGEELYGNRATVFIGARIEPLQKERHFQGMKMKPCLEVILNTDVDNVIKILSNDIVDYVMIGLDLIENEYGNTEMLTDIDLLKGDGKNEE
ncbi:protein kinase domain-containing protein [Citrobacter portucalensis]|uniref:protein kinase domain-containing protein n=1 Tax=Citrobacter portucalensis TaxID=1639133 RepID=UPI002164D40B|nr:protein kinase [Citrobacter portucalensis]MCS1421639.1 protein kinase [Citrobacter portucalensis]